MLRSAEYAKKAFLLADRTSEFERVSFTAYYYRATGEVDKEINAYQLAVRNYPRDMLFHNQLGLIYVDLGRYEEGLKEAMEAARMQPDVDAPYRRQLDAYICLDRLPEARELAGKLRSQRIDTPRIHQRTSNGLPGDDPEPSQKFTVRGQAEGTSVWACEAADQTTTTSAESHRLSNESGDGQRRGSERRLRIDRPMRGPTLSTAIARPLAA
jgi:tetratricopeptide (TPR) repeat protein